MAMSPHACQSDTPPELRLQPLEFILRQGLAVLFLLVPNFQPSCLRVLSRWDLRHFNHPDWGSGGSVDNCFGCSDLARGPRPLTQCFPRAGMLSDSIHLDRRRVTPTGTNAST